jgi:putative hemolysin
MHAPPLSLLSRLSARLRGPPAIDRDFRTIGFLTLLDLSRIPERVRARF